VTADFEGKIGELLERIELLIMQRGLVDHKQCFVT
jgi:hypothetical protein